MSDYAIVNTKEELQSAIEQKTRKIIIINPDLASNIKTVKNTSRVALVAVLGAAGAVATNFWNPIGWGAGLAGIAVGGTSLAAMIALGVGAGVSITLIYALYDGYSIQAKTKVKLSNGVECEAELILEKK